MRTCWIVSGTMAFTLGLVLIGQGGGAGPAAMPEPVFVKLVNQEAKFLQGALGKKALKDKEARKVKGAALLLAAYAQANMKAGTKELATLRDQALQLIKAIDGNQLAEARKLAASLSAKPKVDPKAKTVAVPLHPYLKLEFVMRLFSGTRVGGFGLEKDLETLVEMKGPLDKEQQEKALILAYKTAMIARLAQGYLPEKDEGEKRRKNWALFSKRTQEEALALAASARANKDVAGAADKLVATCTKCHDVFR